MILHRDEARPRVRVRRRQHLHELPREHARRPDVARLAGLHDVVQGLERLLDRRLVVEPVNLIEIHEIGAELADG